MSPSKSDNEDQPMHSIWKFTLSTGAATTIVNMPEGAVVLRFALQHNVPTLWARVDPKNPPASRTFEIVGTGQPIPPSAVYVGTIDSGPFVWHALELRPLATEEG